MIGEQSSQPEEGLQQETISEKEYNFEQMKEIEPAMLSLVAKLKNGIEQGEYSGFLSDDAGGRLVTLVLDKIAKRKITRKSKNIFLGSRK